MRNSPVIMEDHFTPGIKTRPAVFVGSQTASSIHGNAEEQAWEGMYVTNTVDNDVCIVRSMDPAYLSYSQKLIEKNNVINLPNSISGEFLTDILLGDEKIADRVKETMDPLSKLLVFFPTEREQQLADRLAIPLHGSSQISNNIGTKSGIRKLAEREAIAMPQGFICTTEKQVLEALNNLKETFQYVVIKHDKSFSGYFSKKIATDNIRNLKHYLSEISGRKFIDGQETIVVEGWVKSKASLCAHIEIPLGEEPVICAAWQQRIDKDSITYIGAEPLRLSAKALASLKTQVHKLAQALKDEGAHGSFGPDFLVVADEEASAEPDTCLLVELNARIPWTAVPLETIKLVKGSIGEGFCAQHIHLNKPAKFSEIAATLQQNGLLITEKGKKTGVIPYDINLLPWKLFDVVAIAETSEEADAIMQKVTSLFHT